MFNHDVFIDFKVEGKEREKHGPFVPSIHEFIGWVLHVLWMGIELTTLAYWDDAVTNRASWLGQMYKT